MKNIKISVFGDRDEEKFRVYLEISDETLRDLDVLYSINRAAVNDAIYKMLYIYILRYPVGVYSHSEKRFVTLVKNLITSEIVSTLYANWFTDNFQGVLLAIEKQREEINRLLNDKLTIIDWYTAFEDDFRKYILYLLQLYDTYILFKDRIPGGILEGCKQELWKNITEMPYSKIRPPVSKRSYRFQHGAKYILEDLSSLITLINSFINYVNGSIEIDTANKLLAFCNDVVKYVNKVSSRIEDEEERKITIRRCVDTLESARELIKTILTKHKELFKEYKQLLTSIENAIVTLKLLVITGK